MASLLLVVFTSRMEKSITLSKIVKMKKNYIIPSVRVIDSLTSSSIVSTSTPPSDGSGGPGKGGTGFGSKDISSFKDTGADDDFWSTSK